MNKRTFRKKAQGALDLSWSTVIPVVLSVGAILGLTLFIAHIWNVFVPDTEKATVRNFEQLVASIESMEAGASFSSYPLFVDEDYAIVGYQSGERAITGICAPQNLLTEVSNPKPEQCGIGIEGCLCLCENTGDFATLCRENDHIEQCATVETFGKDYSFTGGTYTDGGSCSFALVLGAENVQNIYLKKTEDTVRICAKECDASSAASSTALVSSTSPDASPSVIATIQNVLIIGDSQSMGDYGSTLYELFKTDVSTVNEYAICGATPSYYLKGSSIPSCAARYIYEDDSADGNKKTITSGTTPLLRSLLEEHTPDIVFVTFASNMLYAYSNDKIDEEGIATDVASFAEKVTATASCIWVGPPQGPRYADLEEYRTFKNIIKESAENNGCTFIDSEEYTLFAFCGENTFGCASGTDPHFSNYGAAGKTAAQAWAQGVYDAFMSSLSVS